MTQLRCLLIALFFYTKSHGLALDVMDSEGQVMHQHYSSHFLLPASVGQITVEVFDGAQIPYVGNELGMHEIFSIQPHLEVISKGEMKAYGWCFSINGEVLETLPHDTVITEQDTSIVWFYAYAHFKDGEWIAQCVRP